MIFFIKNVAFTKRTFSLISPIPVFSLFLRGVSFLSGASGFEITLNSYSGKDISPDSGFALAEKILNKNSYENVINRGSIWEIPLLNGSNNLIVEQLNPFSRVSSWEEYKFEEAKIGYISSNIDKEIQFLREEDEEKYFLEQDKFLQSNIANKGDLKLAAEFELSLNEKSIRLVASALISLKDLIWSESLSVPVLSISKNDSLKKEDYEIKLSKDNFSKRLYVELIKVIPFNRSEVSAVSEDIDNYVKVEIKTFYFLFTENPDLDFSKIFSSGIEENRIFSFNERSRMVYLDDWSNKSNKAPKFDFSTSPDFWKSTCKDPYKVAGFIDRDLSEVSLGNSSLGFENDKSEDSKIKRQLKSYKEFKVGVDIKPRPSKQYYWDQISDGSFIPSSDYTTASPCEGLDDTTKALFKSYLDSGNEAFSKEPEDRKNIVSRLVPNPVLNFVKDEKTEENRNYPKNKVIQSAFRAWGNSYEKSPKYFGVYNEIFELAAQTDHSFEIKVERKDLEERLIDHEKLKGVNEKQEISSVLQITFPMSFQVYDPVSNFLKKQRIFIQIELDLRLIYNRSFFSKKEFSYDLSTENGFMGLDYSGYSPFLKEGKPFGVSGFLDFYSGLELDVDKNLIVRITSQTRGFVNTKNPTCDLRHRGGVTFKNSEGEFKCSLNQGWSLRKHNYIPSFLVLSLEQEPKVKSFYIDRRTSNTFLQLIRSKRTINEKKEISTLKEFKDSLENREIQKVFDLDKTNDGEVYYSNISSYEPIYKDDFGIENNVVDRGLFYSNYYQQIYYYAPLRSTNKIYLENSDNLSSIELELSGSSALSNYFFRSGHWNTVMTLCTSTSTGSYEKECADGKKYEDLEEYKTSSELSIKEGNQKVVLNWEAIKEKEKNLTFRTIIHRGNKENNVALKWNSDLSKYKKLLSDNSEDMTIENRSEYPDWSMIAVWYSLDLKYCSEKKELSYVTKIRAISMVSEPVGNNTSHKAIGASGSAGFQIKRIELKYQKKNI